MKAEQENRAGKTGIGVRYIEEVESSGLLTNWICR